MIKEKQKQKPQTYYLLQHQEKIELELHDYIFSENRLILSLYSTVCLIHYIIYRIKNRLVEISAILLPDPEMSIVVIGNHIFWMLEVQYKHNNLYFFISGMFMTYQSRYKEERN